MICPNCHTDNDARFRFCKKCGTALVAPQPQDLLNFDAPLPQPPSQPTPPVMPTQAPSVPATIPQKTTIQINLPSVDQGLFNIWGPFAGFGDRRKHQGWLLENRGENASELSLKIAEKLAGCAVPQADIKKQVLRDQGILVRQRNYFIIKYNNTRTALYVTSLGKDLYLSLVSYLNLPLSNVRILIFILMLLYPIFYPFIASSTFSSMGNQFNQGNMNIPTSVFLVGCIFGPLMLIDLLVLFGCLIFSVYKWLTEKYFTFLLREAPNEFDEDDLKGIQKVVKSKVVTSLDEMGIHVDSLKPTNKSNGPRLF